MRFLSAFVLTALGIRSPLGADCDDSDIETHSIDPAEESGTCLSVATP